MKYVVVEINSNEIIPTATTRWGVPLEMSHRDADVLCEKRIGETCGGPVFVVEARVASFVVGLEADKTGFRTVGKNPERWGWCGAPADDGQRAVYLAARNIQVALS